MAEAAAAWEGTNVHNLSMDTEDHRRHLRMLEAILFAASEPLSTKQIAQRMPEGIELDALLHELQTAYAGRGINLRRTDDSWAFRTAEDLAFVLKREVVQEKRLSRAAVETLAVIAYHQPVTRAEIEEIRGVSLSRGTLDVLLEAGWVRLRGRRRAPGRPVTFGTTPNFLDHFGLESIGDLPGLADLKAAGLLDAMISPEDEEPQPTDDEALQEDEEALDQDFSDLEDTEGLQEEDEEAAAEAGPERDI
jgi:segregation and condensation protein B